MSTSNRAKKFLTRPSRRSQRIFSRFLLNAKKTARLNVTRSSSCGTAPSGCSQTTFVRSTRRTAQTTLVARHASASARAGDTTGVDRAAEAATIDATMIDAMMPMVDWDATDATDTTTNQNAETATVEAIVTRDAEAMNVERRRKKGRGKKMTVKKVDATIATNVTPAIDTIKLTRTISILATLVATTRQKTTTRTRTLAMRTPQS